MKRKNFVIAVVAILGLSAAIVIANENLDGDANAGNVVMGVPLGNTLYMGG